MATATDVDFIEMRIGKVVALKSDDHPIGCIVLTRCPETATS